MVELLVVIAIIGILVALLLPAVQAARESARRSQCLNKFRQVGVAIQNYQTAKKIYPPGIHMWSGVAGSCSTPPGETSNLGWSFSTFILPYLEEQQVYDMFDFKLRHYTTGVNYKAGAVFIDAYLCPSDPQGRELVGCCSGNTNGTTDAEDLARTNMAGVADSKDWTCDGFWPGQKKDGMMFSNSKLTNAKIGDGTSHTLVVGEIVGGGQGSNGGFFWVTWNVLHTKNGLNLGVRVPIRNAWSVAEGGFASFHPGGLHFALADGSANFISESIDYQTLAALTTRDNGDLIPPTP